MLYTSIYTIRYLGTYSDHEFYNNMKLEPRLSTVEALHNRSIYTSVKSYSLNNKETDVAITLSSW